jgi:hypothetical protein
MDAEHRQAIVRIYGGLARSAPRENSKHSDAAPPGPEGDDADLVDGRPLGSGRRLS